MFDQSPAPEPVLERSDALARCSDSAADRSALWSPRMRIAANVSCGSILAFPLAAYVGCHMLGSGIAGTAVTADIEAAGVAKLAEWLGPALGSGTGSIEAAGGSGAGNGIGTTGSALGCWGVGMCV